MRASAARRTNRGQQRCNRRDRHHLTVGHELLRLVERECQGLGIDRIGLRDGDHSAVDAEQPQHRKVLECLRASPLLGVDDEEKEVDPGGAGNHRADEALVAGDVDE